MNLLTCQRYLADGKYPSTQWGHLIIIGDVAVAVMVSLSSLLTLSLFTGEIYQQTESYRSLL